MDIDGSQQIWMLDNINSYFSISKYSLDGKFIEKVKSTLMADFMDFISSGKLLFSTSNQCNDDFCSDLFTTDLNLNLISKTNKPYPLYEELWLEPNNPIFISKTGASAISYGHNEIVKVDPGTGQLINDINIDFGSCGMSSGLLEKTHDSIEEYLFEVQKEKACHQIDNLFHTNENLFFSFDYGSKEYFYLKSPHHNKGVIIKEIILKTGVDVELPINIIGSKNNTLFSLLDSEELMEFYKKYKHKIDKHEGWLQSLLKNITNSSNPIILKLRFK